MKLYFDPKIADKYNSPSQKIRVLTEDWVGRQVYCPNCGNLEIGKYKNNKPVADFFCSNCKEDYELKSKKDSFGNKIVDGAYRTMVEQLLSANNPNLFLLNYDLRDYSVLNFLVIPKHFFVPDIIEKRKPLSKMARRAGWVGCNILLQDIPQPGKIWLVKNRQNIPKENVMTNWQRTLFLREAKEVGAKGWLLDVMNCVEKLGAKEFSLKEIYTFEEHLSKKHPENKHIKDKIRQQLQFLRNKGYLEFLEKGFYRLK